MSLAADPRLLSKAGVVVRCATAGLAALTRPVYWGLLLSWLAARLLTLAGVARFPHPPATSLEPLFRAALGERGVHFPSSWEAVPVVTGWLLRATDWLAGVPTEVLGVAVLPAVFLGVGGRGRAARAAISRIPAAWGMALPGALLAFAFRMAADRLPDAAGWGDLGRAGTAVSLAAADALVRAFLAYGLALVVLEGRGPIGAIVGSIRFASHHVVTSLAFVAAAVGPPAFVRSLRGAPAALFGSHAPETIGIWSAVEVGVGWLGSAFALAAATRLWLHYRDVSPSIGAKGEDA